MTKKVVDAVYLEESKKPKCPNCLYNVKIAVVDYGVEEGQFYFINECELCDKPIRHITDSNFNPIKTRIVERK